MSLNDHCSLFLWGVMYNGPYVHYNTCPCWNCLGAVRNPHSCLKLLHRGSRVTIADGHHAGLPRVLTTEHFELPRIADPVSIVGGHYAELSRTSPQTVSSCHESRIQSDNREWLLRGIPPRMRLKRAHLRMILQRSHPG